MFLDGPSVKENLVLRSLLNVLTDILYRFSSKDASLQQPLRSVLSIDQEEKYLLNLPCIDTRRGFMSVKTISSYPKSEPAIDGVVSLFDARNGRLLLIADAKQITAQRTAAVSFLATELLAFPKWTDEQRNECSLAIVGCGVQGRAHLEVFTDLFSWKKIYLWSRNVTQAERIREEYVKNGLNIEILNGLDDERLRCSDVICTCTSSEQSLISLKQVKSGVHINAVGSYRSHMRELADDLMLSTNTRVYVDSRESAGKEAGEIIQSKATITGELGELCDGKTRFDHPISTEIITIFKSVGMAIEDLAAAIVLHEKQH